MVRTSTKALARSPFIEGGGKEVAGLYTVKEAIARTGLNWGVYKGKIMDAETRKIVPDQFLIKRDDTKAILAKGTFTKQMTLLPNADAFSWFEPFVEEEEAFIESAGALLGGARIWLKARLPQQFEPVKNDVVQDGILLTHSHDGRYALRIGHTPTRIECENTLNAAIGGMSDRAGINVTIRHMPGMTDKMLIARETLKAEIQAMSESWIVEADAMVATLFKAAEVEQWVIDVVQADRVLSGRAERKTAMNTLHPKQRDIASIILGLTEEGRGQQIPGVQGTGWGLYNAVTEYVDHYAGTDPQQRLLNGLWLGGARLKETAAAMATGELTLAN